MKKIGYNLIKKQYDKPARLIGGVSKWYKDSEYNPSNYTFDVLIGSYVEKNLQEAGVLELWFEPVFNCKQSIQFCFGIHKPTKKDISQIKKVTGKIIDTHEIFPHISSFSIEYISKLSELSSQLNISIVATGIIKNKDTYFKGYVRLNPSGEWIGMEENETGGWDEVFLHNLAE